MGDQGKCKSKGGHKIILNMCINTPNTSQKSTCCFYIARVYSSSDLLLNSHNLPDIVSFIGLSLHQSPFCFCLPRLQHNILLLTGQTNQALSSPVLISGLICHLRREWEWGCSPKKCEINISQT